MDEEALVFIQIPRAKLPHLTAKLRALFNLLKYSLLLLFEVVDHHDRVQLFVRYRHPCSNLGDKGAQAVHGSLGLNVRELKIVFLRGFFDVLNLEFRVVAGFVLQVVWR